MPPLQKGDIFDNFLNFEFYSDIDKVFTRLELDLALYIGWDEVSGQTWIYHHKKGLLYNYANSNSLEYYK